MDAGNEQLTTEEAASLAAKLSSTPPTDLPTDPVTLAAALGVEPTKLTRELEILRHERRIAELDRQRREEEERLRTIREADQTPEDDAETRRDAFQKRLERMDAWQHRSEETAEEPQKPTKPRFNPFVVTVMAAIVLFVLFQIASFSCGQMAAPKR